MKCYFDISNFTEEISRFSLLLFSSFFMHCSLKKVFLSLLAIFWNSTFTCFYLSFSLLLFTSLLFTAICKASSDSHLAFLHFFFLGMVLITASCTMAWTSIHSSSDTLKYALFNSKRICCTAGASGDSGSSTGSGRSPGGGHGNPLQYSFLEDPWAEEPRGLQSLESQRVRHNWSDLARTHPCAR